MTGEIDTSKEGADMEDDKTDGRAHVLTVVDWGGWRCRLERWYSEYMGEWYTGVTVRDSDGKEAYHAGMTGVEMTVEAALDEIGRARRLIDGLRGFKEEVGWTNEQNER